MGYGIWDMGFIRNPYSVICPLNVTLSVEESEIDSSPAAQNDGGEILRLRLRMTFFRGFK